MNDGIEQADDLAQLLAAQAPSRKDVEVEALQYGYNGMFSDRPTVKEAAEYLEYARSRKRIGYHSRVSASDEHEGFTSGEKEFNPKGLCVV